MLKNVSVIVCSLFLLNVFAFAAPSKANAPENSKPALSQKEERAQYKQELEALVAKYNAASIDNKESVRAQIKALIAKETDRQIERKKARIAALENEIASISASKNAYIETRVDRALRTKTKRHRG
jgi:hypothetical protein